MQEFPKLANQQVALMRADTLKGYILDENFALATTTTQIVFTVMNSFDDALELANQIIKEHAEIECVIYDQNKKVLSFLRPE